MSNLTVAKETKDYCTTHKPVMKKDVWEGYTVYIHGFENDSNKAYVSEYYGTTLKYRKLAVRADGKGLKYIQIDSSRFYINTFTKIEEDNT